VQKVEMKMEVPAKGVGTVAERAEVGMEAEATVVALGPEDPVPRAWTDMSELYM
jgi:hypothetical protein